MRLITAIAALALVAGSVDVDAQRGGAKGERPERGVEDGGHHPNPLGRIAIIAFGEMDEETHRELVESAKEGDEAARQELHEAQKNALRAMAEALKDEDQSKLIQAGIMLAGSRIGIDDTEATSGLTDRHQQKVGTSEYPSISYPELSVYSRAVENLMAHLDARIRRNKSGGQRSDVTLFVDGKEIVQTASLGAAVSSLIIYAVENPGLTDFEIVANEQGLLDAGRYAEVYINNLKPIDLRKLRSIEDLPRIEDLVPPIELGVHIDPRITEQFGPEAIVAAMEELRQIILARSEGVEPVTVMMISCGISALGFAYSVYKDMTEEPSEFSPEGDFDNDGEKNGTDPDDDNDGVLDLDDPYPFNADYNITAESEAGIPMIIAKAPEALLQVQFRWMQLYQLHR